MIRNLLIAAALATSAVLVAPATLRADAPDTQPAPGAQHARPHPLDRIRDALEKLNLSDEQKEKVHKIMEDARAEIKPLLEADKGDREKLRADIGPIMKATFEKIAAVLTDEQKTKLKELMQAAREAHGDHPGAAPAPQ